MTPDDTLYYTICREAENKAFRQFLSNCWRRITFRHIIQTSSERRNEAFYAAWRRERNGR